MNTQRAVALCHTQAPRLGPFEAGRVLVRHGDDLLRIQLAEQFEGAQKLLQKRIHDLNLGMIF